MKRGWFGPKVFGWGASPASLEGWIVTGLYVVATTIVINLFRYESWGWIPPVALLAAYLVVVVLTYDKNARADI